MPKQPPIAKADLQKTQGARTPTAVKNNNDVISFINQPSMKEQLAAALPRHMTAERMIRIATTESGRARFIGNINIPFQDAFTAWVLMKWKLKRLHPKRTRSLQNKEPGRFLVLTTVLPE